MATNGKWLGNDGQWYDTLIEKNTADTAWSKQREEQQQQNELIAEQNRLLQEQAQREEERVREQREYDRQQERIRELEEEEQREYEANKRIIKLFDSIGLHKQYYDDFMRYLINDEIAKLLDDIENLKDCILWDNNYIKQLDGILKSPVDNIHKYQRDVRNFNKLSFDSQVEFADMNPQDNWIDEAIEKCYSGSKEEEKIKNKLVECMNDISLLNTLTSKENHYFHGYEYKGYMRKRSKNNVIAVLSGIAAFIFYIIGKIVKLDNGSYGWLYIIAIIMAIIYIICSSNSAECKSIIEANLKKCIDGMDCVELDKNKIIKMFTKEKKKYQDKVKEHNNQVLDIEKEISKKVESKWNDFVDFRKKHYNSQLEKVLLDVGLNKQIKKLGLEYPKINNNNKTGDGTIEDYIAYFDSLTE